MDNQQSGTRITSMDSEVGRSGRVRVAVLAGAAILALAGALYVLRRPLMMVVPACTGGQWTICLTTVNGDLLLTVAALPVALLLVAALAHRRRLAGTPAAWRLSLAEVGLVYWTVPWVWLTLQPGPGAGVVPGRVSLVPLRDLLTMDTGQIVGNLLILAGLGFFAPIRFRALASAPRMLALGAACSALIETAQYAFQLDRVSSIDDVLLNATGAALAALASRRWWRA
ncbi:MULTISPECIES: VanZ family protein [unclassified Actinoplanes]|uniref:VanZ family protein n=1 Tax=unclassified Actinoplanes TaxID=2626549 RepID=UPI0002E5CD40|nr:MULTISPECIES: VanZ family protein [unclassified Actinoplanes]